MREGEPVRPPGALWLKSPGRRLRTSLAGVIVGVESVFSLIATRSRRCHSGPVQWCRPKIDRFLRVFVRGRPVRLALNAARAIWLYPSPNLQRKPHTHG